MHIELHTNSMLKSDYNNKAEKESKIMLREKAAKLVKFVFAGLTRALCVTAFNPAADVKAGMLQESEPNNNPATADNLPLNTWLKGTADYKDEDWYQFTISQKGVTSFELKLDDSNAQTDSMWHFELYDAKRRTLGEWNINSAVSGKFSWMPGKYYIKIKSSGSYRSNGEYNLAIHNKASNVWEQERYYGDKSLSNANIISLNKQYTGKLYCGSDVDYYRLKLKGLNGVAFKFTIDNSVSDPGTWRIEFIEYNSRISLGSYGISTNETLQIPRCSGDLLVKISTNRYYESASGDIYHIKAANRFPTTEITSISGVSDRTRSVSLSWKKVKNATGYYIYRSTSRDGEYKKIATTSKTSYTDKKIPEMNTYYYKIAAYRKTGSQISKSYLSDYYKGIIVY